MRATACVGVLSEGPDGKFSQTPMSAVLRSDANSQPAGLCHYDRQRVARHAAGPTWIIASAPANKRWNKSMALTSSNISSKIRAEGQIFNDAMTADIHDR